MQTLACLFILLQINIICTSRAKNTATTPAKLDYAGVAAQACQR
jgi:hypothetical protein